MPVPLTPLVESRESASPCLLSGSPTKQKILTPMSSPESSSLSPVSSPYSSPILSPLTNKTGYSKSIPKSKMCLGSPMRSPNKNSMSPFAAGGLLGSSPRRISSPGVGAVVSPKCASPHSSPDRENRSVAPQ